ncbi:hypothetical protein TNCV_3056221 [Trichonephila clavipes]|nr:hypothetical protein TNCV_3056221 [Trichonephila clavipes]
MRFGTVKPSLPALFPSRPRDVTPVSSSSAALFLQPLPSPTSDHPRIFSQWFFTAADSCSGRGSSPPTPRPPTWTRRLNPKPIPVADLLLLLHPDSKILEKISGKRTTPTNACCVYLDNIIDNVDTYDFQTGTAKNQFYFHAYQFQEEARSRYISLRDDEFNAEKECHEDFLKQWGRPTEKELAEFVPVVTKKTKEQNALANERKLVGQKTQNKLR